MEKKNSAKNVNHNNCFDVFIRVKRNNRIKIMVNILFNL